MCAPHDRSLNVDAILKYDRSKELGRIKAPTLVVGSRNDVVCPPHYSEQLAALIPGAELNLYADGGHFFYMAYADRFNAELRAFIMKHE